MEIRLERRRGRPVYRQIADQIRGRVDSGELSEGDRLPPIRDLAQSLGVNRDTVALAYEALAADGVVAARVGRGTFVRGRRPRGVQLGSSGEPVLSPLVDRLLDYERLVPATAPDPT